jgi:hypothetical protein
MAVALDSHFRVTVARECLHDGNVEPSIEEQMNGGMAQVVEAERSHTRDWPQAIVVLRAKPEAIVVGLLSVSATSLPVSEPVIEPAFGRPSERTCRSDSGRCYQSQTEHLGGQLLKKDAQLLCQCHPLDSVCVGNCLRPHGQTATSVLVQASTPLRLRRGGDAIRGNRRPLRLRSDSDVRLELCGRPALLGSPNQEVLRLFGRKFVRLQLLASQIPSSRFVAGFNASTSRIALRLNGSFPFELGESVVE